MSDEELLFVPLLQGKHCWGSIPQVLEQFLDGRGIIAERIIRYTAQSVQHL